MPEKEYVAETSNNTFKRYAPALPVIIGSSNPNLKQP